MISTLQHDCNTLEPDSLPALRSRVSETFARTYGRLPTCFAAAPGRVNLIGEHVDYNGGLVLPAAIERWICAAARRRTDDWIVIQDIRLDDGCMFSARNIAPVSPSAPGQSPRNWTHYVKGVVAGFVAQGHPIGGLELCFTSTLPIGGGLSSSAALEGVIAMTLCRLFGISMDRLALARLCQQAEHKYAGVPCGLMDQAAVLMAREGHLLQLDCSDDSTAHILWPSEDWRLMILNSGISHSLASGEYARRRCACENAARLLAVPYLSRLSLADLPRIESHPSLSAEHVRCVRHVITENARTQALTAALGSNDYNAAGVALKASHASLRDDFRVSCPELDFIAETANQLEGVAGCRMTGAGFGGSAVAMVHASAVEAAREHLLLAYRERFNRELEVFCTRPVAGAEAYDL